MGACAVPGVARRSAAASTVSGDGLSRASVRRVGPVSSRVGQRLRLRDRGAARQPHAPAACTSRDHIGPGERGDPRSTRPRTAARLPWCWTLRRASRTGTAAPRRWTGYGLAAERRGGPRGRGLWQPTRRLQPAPNRARSTPCGRFVVGPCGPGRDPTPCFGPRNKQAGERRKEKRREGGPGTGRTPAGMTSCR
jgi:hypothetical protein